VNSRRLWLYALSESIDGFGELVANILDNAGGIVLFFSKESSVTMATQTSYQYLLDFFATRIVSFSFSTKSSATVATQTCASDPIGILFDLFATPGILPEIPNVLPHDAAIDFSSRGDAYRWQSFGIMLTRCAY
jgi:hypothetical protein